MTNETQHLTTWRHAITPGQRVRVEGHRGAFTAVSEPSVAFQSIALDDGTRVTIHPLSSVFPYRHAGFAEQMRRALERDRG